MQTSGTRAESLYLPPRDTWLINPYSTEKIETPLVDEDSHVDVKQLIYEVKKTVAPDYRWPSSFNDEHHLQWPNRWYESSSDAETNPQRFRNLVISRAVVPRVFHNWLHVVTDPPPVPSDEVRRYRIEAQNVTMKLFHAAKQSVRLTRSDRLTEAKLESELMHKFDDFMELFERAKAIPKPFQLVDTDSIEIHHPNDIARIRKQLGKYATPFVAVRTITEPIAA